MLMCNETVTLVRHIAERDGDRYECIAIVGASWYGKAQMVVSVQGAAPQNTYKGRIPEALMPTGITPCKGDWLVRGVIASVDRAPDAFANREHFRITAVGDNRRGRFSHWVVSG